MSCKDRKNEGREAKKQGEGASWIYFAQPSLTLSMGNLVSRA